MATTSGFDAHEASSEYRPKGSGEELHRRLQPRHLNMIALGGVIALFFGDALVSWYAGLL